MPEATFSGYEEAPESILLTGWAGEEASLEGWCCGDFPLPADKQDSGKLVYRYIRADLIYAEVDMATIPARYQADSLAWRDLVDVMMVKALSDLKDLKDEVDRPAKSTRDRLQNLRGCIESMVSTWQDRLEARRGLKEAIGEFTNSDVTEEDLI